MMQKLFIEKQKDLTIQKLNKYVENLNEKFVRCKTIEKSDEFEVLKFLISPNF